MANSERAIDTTRIAIQHSFTLVNDAAKQQSQVVDPLHDPSQTEQPVPEGIRTWHSRIHPVCMMAHGVLAVKAKRQEA